MSKPVDNKSTPDKKPSWLGTWARNAAIGAVTSPDNWSKAYKILTGSDLQTPNTTDSGQPTVTADGTTPGTTNITVPGSLNDTMSMLRNGIGSWSNGSTQTSTEPRGQNSTAPVTIQVPAIPTSWDQVQRNLSNAVTEKALDYQAKIKHQPAPPVYNYTPKEYPQAYNEIRDLLDDIIFYNLPTHALTSVASNNILQTGVKQTVARPFWATLPFRSKAFTTVAGIPFSAGGGIIGSSAAPAHKYTSWWDDLENPIPEGELQKGYDAWTDFSTGARKWPFYPNWLVSPEMDKSINDTAWSVYKALPLALYGTAAIPGGAYRNMLTGGQFYKDHPNSYAATSSRNLGKMLFATGQVAKSANDVRGFGETMRYYGIPTLFGDMSYMDIPEAMIGEYGTGGHAAYADRMIKQFPPGQYWSPSDLQKVWDIETQRDIPYQQELALLQGYMNRYGKKFATDPKYGKRWWSGSVDDNLSVIRDHLYNTMDLGVSAISAVDKHLPLAGDMASTFLTNAIHSSPPMQNIQNTLTTLRTEYPIVAEPLTSVQNLLAGVNTGGLDYAVRAADQLGEIRKANPDLADKLPTPEQVLDAYTSFGSRLMSMHTSIDDLKQKYPAATQPILEFQEWLGSQEVSPETISGAIQRTVSAFESIDSPEAKELAVQGVAALHYIARTGDFNPLNYVAYARRALNYMQRLETHGVPENKEDASDPKWLTQGAYSLGSSGLPAIGALYIPNDIEPIDTWRAQGYVRPVTPRLGVQGARLNEYPMRPHGFNGIQDLRYLP